MQPEKVYVFDTTLRDGEQAAGTRLGRREKLSIARQLSQLRVDIIEAGYPNSSPEDFSAVEDIAREIRDVTICALSRAVPEDIHACGKALAKARRPRIHTGIGASDIHIMGKFRDDKYGRTLAEKKIAILKMAVESVKLAKSYADDVEFYAEDSGRSDQAYLFEMLEAVIDAGATVLNIPDTTGYTVPEQYGALIRDIRTKVRNAGMVTISVLPRRLRARSSEHACGNSEWRETSRSHHKRNRRTSRQRITRRDRHGDSDSRRLLQSPDGYRGARIQPDQPFGFGAAGNPGSSQQGNRRRECFLS